MLSGRSHEHLIMLDLCKTERCPWRGRSQLQELCDWKLSSESGSQVREVYISRDSFDSEEIWSGTRLNLLKIPCWLTGCTYRQLDIERV